MNDSRFVLGGIIGLHDIVVELIQIRFDADDSLLAAMAEPLNLKCIAAHKLIY